MALNIYADMADKEYEFISFRKALTGIALDLAHYWQHPIQRSNPNLDVFFTSYGHDKTPEFEGMRLHSFERDSNTLKVELSIPQKILRSHYVKSYVVAAIQDAVDAADEFFKVQQIGFQKDDYLSLINTFNGCRGKQLH